jgi:hypothetical protein
MGQQQLLLLVLSTVIVGLATVAGIQAFDEGQTQATQDALTQRALSIGSDIYSSIQEPTQFGGISETESNASKIAASAGFNSDTDIPADGAGGSADCVITTEPIQVTCADDDTGNDSDASTNQSVVVNVDSDGPSVTSINSTSVGS